MPGKAKKRNFKSLKLEEDLLSPPVATENITVKHLGSRKILLGERGSPRRSPLSLITTPNTLQFKQDNSLLGLSPESARPTRSALHASLSTTIASLDLNPSNDAWQSLRKEEFKILGEIGFGTGGSVFKVEHLPSGRVLARKSVIVDGHPTIRKKQLLLEVQVAHSCVSSYLVRSYGAFLDAPNLMICMEYMDLGSFDKIYRQHGPVSIGVVAHVGIATLRALQYLADRHRIVHRDVKPSNVLLNSHGSVKLCDFGVCEQTEGVKATAFVGTSVYMSPERVQGMAHGVKSDVWSLGLTLIELAHGRFPFADPVSSPSAEGYRRLLGSSPSPRQDRTETPLTSANQFCIIELMHQIVSEPPPVLDRSKFSVEAQDFVNSCLAKDADLRLGPEELLENVWLLDTTARTDMKAWAQAL